MTLIAFIAIANANQVYAEQVASHRDEQQSSCSFKMDKGIINFSAYQPHINHKSLCRKFPGETGITYFSLDLLDEKLRGRVLQIKVIPIMQGDGELQTSKPVVSMEITSSPTGVVTFEYDFKGATGRYRLDVLNEVENTQGSFEFEVGAKEFEWDSKFGQKVAFGVFGVFAIFMLSARLMRKNKA